MTWSFGQASRCLAPHSTLSFHRGSWHPGEDSTRTTLIISICPNYGVTGPHTATSPSPWSSTLSRRERKRDALRAEQLETRPFCVADHPALTKWDLRFSFTSKNSARALLSFQSLRSFFVPLLPKVLTLGVWVLGKSIGGEKARICHLISTRLFPNLKTNLPLLLPLRKMLGEKVNSW